MRATAQISPSAAALWASAFVIAALIIVGAGRLQGPSARAETAASRADYTLLTGRSGRGRDERPNEVLYVIDSRDQVLMVYEVEDAQRKQITALAGGPLDNLFRAARR